CFRFAFNITKSEHITYYYNQAAILKFKHRHILLVARLVYKIVSTGKHQYLNNILVKRSECHSRELRYVDNYNLPIHNLEFKASFSYSATWILNNYKRYFNEKSLVQFTVLLKNHLLAQQRMCS